MSSSQPDKSPSRKELVKETPQRRESTRIGKIRKRKVSISISAKVLGEAKPEDLSKGVAYVFSKGGNLLGTSPLNGEGGATVDVDLAELENSQALRVIVGPRIGEKATAGELLRLGGEQAFLQVEPKLNKKVTEIPLIPKQILCWLLSRCQVQGKVLKKVVSGGISMDLPVCDATVEIYEVDPIYLLIPKLPDYIIKEIRDFIVKPYPPPPPPEEMFEQAVTIGPLPPGPLRFGTQALNLSTSRKAEITMPVMTFVSLGDTYTERSPSVENMFMGEDMQRLKTLANTTSIDQFRQVLINYSSITKYIICRFPHIIPRMDLVATAITAECGKFKAMFFRGCKNPDIPDLYFIVKQKIFPFLPPLSIYKPTPVLCHTYWNYTCGTEVTLYVTSPLARTCAPCPDIDAEPGWVLFMAIGNLPMSGIRGTSLDKAATTTTSNLGLADDAPFGEILRPRIEFDNMLREELGVKYYQVSYRAGTIGPFTPIIATINRHYTHKIGTDLVLEVYNLGPKSEKSPGVPLINKQLFEIPPALPPIGQWSIYDAVEDTANAKFDTLTLGPVQDYGVAWPQSGLYQFKVDLFDEDGNLIDIDALNIKYHVPTSTDISGTVHTENAANNTFTSTGVMPTTGLVQDDDGDGKKSLIVALHLDNSRCKATLPMPDLDGVAAGDACGVMRYSIGPKPDELPQGSVTIYYRPEHPAGVGTNGFATCTFDVIRGGSTVKVSDSGNTPLPPATLSATRTVQELLDECDTAGFAEHLHVYAKATSGWRRLWEYDHAAVIGFALAPKPKTPGPPSP